jgi:hypothetical protein
VLRAAVRQGIVTEESMIELLASRPDLITGHTRQRYSPGDSRVARTCRRGAFVTV